jgi:hypothetical protein
MVAVRSRRLPASAGCLLGFGGYLVVTVVLSTAPASHPSPVIPYPRSASVPSALEMYGFGCEDEPPDPARSTLHD